jgi:hypothetical protein
MAYLVDELCAEAEGAIAKMREAALAARETHARAELLRHMLWTAGMMKGNRAKLQSLRSSMNGSLPGRSTAPGRMSPRWKRYRPRFSIMCWRRAKRRTAPSAPCSASWSASLQGPGFPSPTRWRGGQVAPMAGGRR